jgi:sulfur-oxidizing protein SoxA
MRRLHRLAPAATLLALAAAGCGGTSVDPAALGPPPPWTSRAIPEAQGALRTAADGKREAVRYRGWTTRDFGAFRTYAYADARPAPPVQKPPMPAIAGDPKEGRKLFLSRSIGPCTGCHLVPGDDVWPAGNVGPDLSTYGDRNLPNEWVFNVIYDARTVFPNTAMPPWGTTGMLKPAEVVHLVAYLQSLRGPIPPEKDPERNPFTRPKPVGFGDNLDPTNNPAVLLAEGALALWQARGPAGKACADCHGATPEKAMKGVATRYPKYVAVHKRVMSIEDYLAVHGPETTGRPHPAQSQDNLNLTMLVKMQSNGLPVQVDVSSPVARAAWERGRATFEKRVGERNHGCADCHTPDKGANRFLGGRLLGDVTDGLTKHFPLWRTSQGQVWDMRKRMQWCMTPLGMNMLAADAPEYAELELYLTSFDVGKPLSVPGIRH